MVTKDILRELEREICKKSFYEFLVRYWDVVVTERLQDNWHIRYLCDELQAVGEQIILRKPKLHDLVINIPPGESKSTICTIYFPVWLWIKDPTLRVITGSYSNTLSMEHSFKSRMVIRNERFQEVFSVDVKKNMDNKTFYMTEQGGERKTVSVGGSVTGSHAHLIIVDDPIDPKQSESEKLRTRANKWMKDTLPTRKVDAKITPTILIMQRLHTDDPSALLLKRKEVKHICLPATDKYDVQPPSLRSMYIDGLLNPLRKDKGVLKEFKSSLGARGFASQMGQSPAPLEGNLIKGEWFDYYNEIDRQEIINKGTVHFFMDTAYEERQITNNDPTAIIAFVPLRNRLYILEVVEIWKDLPSLITYIPKFLERNHYSNRSRVKVEPKASGKSVIQVLKRETNINVSSSPSPSTSKLTRVVGISPFLESRRVVLPKGGGWVDSFLHQCMFFPNATHDDMVDCLVGAIQMVNKQHKTKTHII